MVTHNVCTETGISNGAQLVLTQITNHFLFGILTSGFKKGQLVSIPKFVFTNSDPLRPLVRIQFPVSLAYATTICKSQGQTFDSVGVYLKDPVFAHGMLYVGLSRVRDSARLKVAIDGSSFEASTRRGGMKTRNIVWEEALKGLD